jgi:hypothetical protein
LSSLPSFLSGTSVALSLGGRGVQERKREPKHSHLIPKSRRKGTLTSKQQLCLWLPRFLGLCVV